MRRCLVRVPTPSDISAGGAEKQRKVAGYVVPQCSRAAVRMKHMCPSSNSSEGDAVGQDAAAGVSNYTRKGQRDA